MATGYIRSFLFFFVGVVLVNIGSFTEVLVLLQPLCLTILVWTNRIIPKMVWTNAGIVRKNVRIVFLV